MKRMADFFFEAGILKRTPRSGWFFLPGSQGESVADHVFRTTLIAWSLARLSPELDADRIMRLALCHDLAEARTSDLNYVHQKYLRVDEERAAVDQARGLPFEEELVALAEEYREATSPEARIAHDADQLEMLLSLKEALDGGASAAEEWIPFVLRRLHTENARRIAEAILEGQAHDWWFDRESEWWVRGSKDRKS